MIPGYFGVKVVKASDSPTETEGYWTLTEFGQTGIFKIFGVVSLASESILPLISLIVMNTIALVKFRKIKREIADNIDERIQDTLNRYTKLIIILTFIVIITRTFDTTVATFRRIKMMIWIVVADDYEALLKLTRNIGYLLLFAEHALDGLLYYIFDKNMRQFLKGSTNMDAST